MAEFTVYEQLLLELVNRARLDPAAEAKRLGIGLNSGLVSGTITATAKQPLATNDLLEASALAHSQWMLATDVFSHTGVNSSNPGQRMADAGYVFEGSWSWGENIAWQGTTGTPDVETYTLTLHDNLFRSPGHRVNILSDSFREMGAGIAEGQFQYGSTVYNSVMATENFARSGSSYFVTGVAISDADGDSFYDIGEGQAGITVRVSLGGVLKGSDSTGTAGGYVVASSGGMVDVTFSGGGLASDVTVSIVMGAANAKVDLAGTDEILSSVSATLGTGAQALTLLGIANLSGTGNAGANQIKGNAGSNSLYGAGGDDTLTGGLGRDILSGGEGFDTFDYNAVAETGKSATTRDRILDFVQGEDQIDLSSIDAYSKLGGDQAFTWRATSGFSGGSGQIRFVKQDLTGSLNDRTIVSGDINGDKRADFHIELAGLHNLTADDFIL